MLEATKMNRKLIITNAITFGLISGILSIVLFLIIHQVGQNPVHMGWTTVSLGIPLMAICWSIFYFKNKHQNGILHLGEGLMTGLITALVGVNIASLGIYILLSVKPEIITDYQAIMIKDFALHKMELVKNFKNGEKGYLELIYNIKSSTATSLSLDYFIKSSAIQFIVALFAAAFFRKV